MYSILAALTLTWLTLLLVFFGPNHVELSPFMDPRTFIPLSSIAWTAISLLLGITIALFLGDNLKRTRVTTQTRKLVTLRNADGSKSKLFIAVAPALNGSVYHICCQNDDGSLEHVSFNRAQTTLVSEDESLTEEGIWMTTHLQPDVSDRRLPWALATVTGSRNELRVPPGTLGTRFLIAAEMQKS